MRLTRILQVYFPLKKNAKGLTYEGKNAKVKPIKTSLKYNFANKLMREEQNKKYLMNPCVSKREEVAYGKAHPERKIQRSKEFIMNRRKPFFPDRLIEEQFHSNLSKLRSWE